MNGGDIRVLVLGGTGMLGSMVADYLGSRSNLDVSATSRAGSDEREWQARLPSVAWQTFDGPEDLEIVSGFDWIVNCIGVIKPFIKDDDAAQVENAIRINGLLPHQLAAATAENGARVIQIATDCVYSGAKGSYVESDLHDALDVYGKTKSLGEVRAPHVHHARASIVGPEAGRSRSLLEWFLGQARGAELRGFVNHRWNGVTTLHFAKICNGIIAGSVEAPPYQHLIPTGEVTKYELLCSFAEHYSRADLSIRPVDAETVIDRTLATEQDAASAALWLGAGYDTAPTVPEMVAELAGYAYGPKAAADAGARA